MAEVTKIRQVQQQNLPPTTIVSRGINAIEGEGKEEEAGSSTDAFDFHLLSPPNPPFIVPSKNGEFSFTTISESEPGNQEFESVQHSDHNFFFYGTGDGEEEEDEEDEDDEQMNFVTDLFGTREGLSNERNFIQSGSGYRYMDEEPELILGLGSSSTITSMDGLRIAGMDSESDSEAMEVDQDGLDQNDDLGSPGFWDCLQYDGQRERGSFTDEFEWEEVNIRENLTSLIDRIEQLSISSFSQSSPFVTEEEEEEENARNVEWQVLLAVNNLDLGSGGYDEYNVQFGELVGEDTTTTSSLRGSPPAAKSVVESLPSIVLTMEDLEDSSNNVVCAVCKDDIPVGLSNVTKLPCLHHYHKDCILPWLAIRNTCPLCRHELPTDDLDYERRKNGNGGGGGGGSHGRTAAPVDHHDDSLVGYNYQLLP